MERRDFLRQCAAASASAIGATAAAAGSVIDGSRDAGDALFTELAERVDQLSAQWSEWTGEWSNRMDGVALRLDLLTGQLAYQQALTKWLLLAVLLSFAIDGGMALHLLTAQPLV